MHKLIFPSRDTTLYQRHPDRNTGVDQILELRKINSGSAVEDLIGQGEYWGSTWVTRVLMDFSLTSVSQSIVDDSVANPEFYLTMKATDAVVLPIEYTVHAHAISGSWTNGTGYYNNDREVTNGASWLYRSAKTAGTLWDTAGGDFYTGSGYEVSQSFNYESPDMRVNVTEIVRTWLSGSIANQGFILKFSETAETDGNDAGWIKFFAKDTHTIYVPRLEAFWDSTDVSGTGSISQISGDDYVIYLQNLRRSYREQEVAKIRVGVRDRHPTKSYSTTGQYLTTKRLPFTTYYQVMDSVTDQVIVPFHANGTQVSCDTTGNYFLLDMDTFLPERYYRLMFKIVDGSVIRYVDENFAFKVHRK